MLFNSFEFLIFLPLVFFVYWFVVQKNLRLQNFFILVVSYVFYGWWDWRFLGLLALSSFVDYFVALGLGKTDNTKSRKILLWISLVMNLGLLGVFKYFNFFSQSFSEAFQQIGITFDPFTLAVVLPVGISFYTFQTLSYTIDVYKKELEPTQDVISFLAYVSFFPQLVAGPIERAANLLPQFYVKRTFSYKQAKEGLTLMVYGFFKKVVIADNCSVIVNDVFANQSERSGAELIMGVVFFAFQIYGDFSGYSDIARGVARFFGFELMVNFRTPYFSRDIAEFWRRWHISLTTWFRDYIYFPMGGSKGSKWNVVRNTAVVFLVSGFWHGANWTFIIWGVINVLLFLPLLLMKQNRKNVDTVGVGGSITLRDVFNMFFTFMLVCFSWIFFRSDSVGSALQYISGIFTHPFLSGQWNNFNYFILVLLSLFLVLEWLSREAGIEQVFLNQSPVMRRVSLLVLALITLLFGNFSNNEFIYFQF